MSMSQHGATRLRSVAVFALALLLAPASALAQEWYDHYERGVAALKRRQPIVAAAAFQRAAQRQSTPGQNLVTYGTNRIAEYYPYVRLAEALAMAGDVELARRALERSEASGKEPAAMRAAVIRMLEEAQRAAAPTPPLTTSTPPPAASTPRAEPPPSLATPAHQIAATTPTPAAAPALAAPTATTVPTSATTRRADVSPGPSIPTAIRAAVAGAAIGGSTPARSPEALASIAPAARGAIEILTTPGNADVYLDDEFIGRSDSGGRLVRRDVTAGRHEVRAANVAGYAENRVTVDLAAGESKVAAVALAPQTESVPRWTRGVLALLALVGVGAIAWLVRARSAAPADDASSAPTRATPRPAASKPATTSAGKTRRVDSADEPTRAAPRDTHSDAPTQALSTDPARVGSQFGDYKLVRELGRGGMAAVFLAEKNGEHVALKRPLAAYLAETEFLERFMREAEIGRTLNHPNIIHILDKGRIGAVPYFTMELVAGETLHALAKREGSLPARRAAQIVKQVAEALDYAHLKGVIHRDLKPSNIMILESGVAKVMDYGIARSARFEGLTVTGAFLGTPEYVAPETAEGGTTDARSDLYALGVIFYELVTGLRPFVGDTPFATLKKHCTEPPRPPSQVKNTPQAVEAVILKLLRKNPAERYPGAEELIIELNEYLDSAAA